MAEVTVLPSKGRLCVAIARVHPSATRERCGVILLRGGGPDAAADAPERPVRFVHDHSVAPGTVEVPFWMHSLQYGRGARASAVLTEIPHSSTQRRGRLTAPGVRECTSVTLRIHRSTPPAASPLHVAHVRAQLAGSCILPGSLLPVLVCGSLVVLQVEAVQPEDADRAYACACISSSTAVSVLPPQPAPTLQIAEDADALVRVLGEKISVLRALEAAGAAEHAERVFLFGGLGLGAEAAVVARLAAGLPDLAICVPPLEMALGSVELEDFEGEHSHRLAHLDSWCRETVGQHCAAGRVPALHLRGLEFLSPPAARQVVAICRSWADLYPTVCFVVFTREASVPQHIVASLQRHQMRPCRLSPQGISPEQHAAGSAQCAFAHLFNTRRLGLAASRSWAEIARERDAFLYSGAGSLVRAGLSSWDRIHGYGSVKSRVRELVGSLSFCAGPARPLGLRPAKGILLYGPSGCGKGEVVRAVAGEGVYPVVQLQAAEILSKYLGESEANLRRAFAKARSSQPCILFIDNIELLGAHRGRADPDSGGAGERLLSTLLNEMDGISGSDGVLVVACARDAALLDGALVRPGRIDHLVEVGLPSREDRRALLEAELARLRFQPAGAATIEQLLDGTEGWSGASLKRLLLGHARGRFNREHAGSPADLDASDLVGGLTKEKYISS